MEHAHFLKLVRIVELVRKCEGQECHVISDEMIAQASAVDSERALHPDHDGTDACAECAEIQTKKIALREQLHSQGIDFPVEVFDAR